MARRRGVLATFVQIQREAERERERQARLAQRAQRDVERAAAAASRAQVQDQKQRERLYAQARVAEAADETAQVEHEVEVLEQVLSATLQVDDFLDLQALKRPPGLPVFDPAVAGPIPTPPLPEQHLPAPSSGLGRVFGSAKHAERVQEGQRSYEDALRRHELDVQQYESTLASARQQHAAANSRLLEEHRLNVEQIDALQRGLARGEPAAVVRYLDLVLEAASYPDGFPHRWRLTYSPGSRQLAVEHELPPSDVVPRVKGYKYVKATDQIAPVARPAAQVRALYASVLAQTALRVVHEVLEADRGAKVRTVVYNGHILGTDPATGRDVRTCVIAYATSRERFLEVDLARAEPAACLLHLEARVSKDAGKLLGVEPIVLQGTLDSDLSAGTEDEDGAAPVWSDEVDQQVSPEPGPATRRLLVAGQNLPIEDPQVEVRLAGDPGDTADLAVLLLDSSGRLARDEEFVFFNNPKSEDESVLLHGGDSPSAASIDLSRLTPRYERLVLVASTSEHTRSVAGTELLLRQPTEPTEMLFRAPDDLHVAALVCGELYRRDGAWRFRAVGQGWTDGLAGLARDFGVDVS